MTPTDPRLHAVLAQLRDRVPVDQRERRSIALFHEHLAPLRAPFDEHADPVHITASAIMVGRRGVVLHRHKRLGIWLQPGGHIEPGEWPHEAARREAFEETGLAAVHPEAGIELVHLDVHPGPRGHTHLDLRYLLEAPDMAPAPLPGESQEVAWFGWAEAIERADPGLRGALVAVSATLGHRPPRGIDGP
jgi:8-oxo-dGTP pyrophosphatase MutT (NUDIX family)